jgi:hypothetical protein
MLQCTGLYKVTDIPDIDGLRKVQKVNDSFKIVTELWESFSVKVAQITEKRPIQWLVVQNGHIYTEINLKELDTNRAFLLHMNGWVETNIQLETFYWWQFKPNKVHNKSITPSENEKGYLIDWKTIDLRRELTYYRSLINWMVEWIQLGDLVVSNILHSLPENWDDPIIEVQSCNTNGIFCELPLYLKLYLRSFEAEVQQLTIDHCNWHSNFRHYQENTQEFRKKFLKSE